MIGCGFGCSCGVVVRITGVAIVNSVVYSIYVYVVCYSWF